MLLKVAGSIGIPVKGQLPNVLREELMKDAELDKVARLVSAPKSIACVPMQVLTFSMDCTV
jgi:hypothetical protein